MFSIRQLIFAGFFIIIFTILSLLSYKKDMKYHQIFYKNTAIRVGLILIAIIVIFITLHILIH